MHLTYYLFGVLLSLASCSPSEATDSVLIADVALNYRNLRLMTPSRVFVNPALAELCVGASEQDVMDARKEHGPHAHAAVHIFMNEAASKAFQNESPKYPTGSIIVKEKHVLSYELPDGSRTDQQNGVGGMVKRKSGFDAEHGDWEYFYFTDVDKIEHGPIDNCVQCHAAAQQTDFVFGTWESAE